MYRYAIVHMCTYMYNLHDRECMTLDVQSDGVSNKSIMCVLYIHMYSTMALNTL